MKKKKKFKVIAGLSSAFLCATMLSAAHVKAEGTSEVPNATSEDFPQELKEKIKGNYWAELTYYTDPKLGSFAVPTYLVNYFKDSVLNWADLGWAEGMMLSMPNSGLVEKEFASLDPDDFEDSEFYKAYFYGYSKKPIYDKLWNPYKFSNKDDMLVGKVEGMEDEEDISPTDYTARGDIVERDKDSRTLMTHDIGDKINLDFSVDVDYLRRYLNTWLIRDLNMQGTNQGITAKNTPETGITQSDAEFIFVVDLPSGLEANTDTKYSIDSTLKDDFDVKYETETRTIKEKVFNKETKEFEEKDVTKNRLVVRMRKTPPKENHYEKLKDFYEKVQGLKNITLKVDNLKVTETAKGKNNTATGYIYGIYDHILTSKEEAIINKNEELADKAVDGFYRYPVFFAAKQSDAGRDETLDKDKANLITYTFRVPYIVNFINHLDKTIQTVKVEGNKSIMDGALDNGKMPEKNPERTHYTFKEWNTAKDGKGNAFDALYKVLSDMNVYAIYDNKAPVLEVEKEKTITQGESLDLMSLVKSATDTEDGDLKKEVTIVDKGGFDNNKYGTYTIKYKVVDGSDEHLFAEATSTITVLPKMMEMNIAPTLTLTDREIFAGERLDLRELIVSATDKEDGDLKTKVELMSDGGFNNLKVGTYVVSFKVFDSKGASAAKTARVIVKDAVVETPGDAPKEEVPVLKTTRFIDEQGKEVKAPVEGFVDVNKYDHIRNDKGEIAYTFKEKLPDTKDVRTYVYTPVVHEVGVPEKNELAVAKTTKHLIEGTNKEIAEAEVGEDFTEHKTGIIEKDGKEYFFNKTDETSEVRTHWYAPVVGEVPNDAPKEEVTVLKTTRFIDEDGKEVKAPVEGFVDVNKYDHIRNDKGEITYTFKEKLPDTKDVRTYVYTPVVHKVGDPLVEEKPEFKYEVGDPEVNELPEMPLDKVPTYSEVPNEAPTAEAPILKTTRHLVKGTDEVLAVDMDFVENRGEIVHNGKVYKYISSLADTTDLRTHYYEEVKQPTPGGQTPPPITPEITPPSEDPSVPEVTPPSEDPSVPEVIPPREEPSVPEVTPPREEPSVPEVTPPSEDPSVPEVTPPSEDPSVPEITPPREEPSVPEVTPPSEDPSVPEITPPSEDPSVPEITPPSEDPSVPEITPPSEDPSVPEITPPSGTTEQEGKTPNAKVTKSENLPTTDAAQNASIFGAGLLGLLMLKLRNRRKER